MLHSFGPEPTLSSTTKSHRSGPSSYCDKLEYSLPYHLWVLLNFLLNNTSPPTACSGRSLERMAQVGVTALFPCAYKLMSRIPRKAHKPHEAMPSPSIPLLPPQVCSLPVKVSLSSQDSVPSPIFFCLECLPLHLIPLSSSKPHPMSLPVSSFPQRLITQHCKCSLLFLKNWTCLCVLCTQHIAWDIEDMNQWMNVFQIHVFNLWDSLESLHDFSFFLNTRKIYTFI